MKKLVIEIPGIAQATSVVLAKHGFITVQDIATSRVGSLSDVPGFAKIRAAQTIEKAKAMLDIIAESEKKGQVKRSKKDKKLKKKSKGKSVSKKKEKKLAKEIAKKIAKAKQKKKIKKKNSNNANKTKR